MRNDGNETAIMANWQYLPGIDRSVSPECARNLEPPPRIG
jgi:hypothetical protein